MFFVHFPQFALSTNSDLCKADPSTMRKGNSTHGITQASDNFLKAVLTFIKASTATRTSRAFGSRSDTHAPVLFQALLHKAQTRCHNLLSMTNTPRTAPRTRSTTAVGAGGHKGRMACFPQFALSKNSDLCEADPGTMRNGNGTHGITQASDNFLKAVLTFMKASTATRTSCAFHPRSDTHAPVLFQSLPRKAQTCCQTLPSMMNPPRTAPRTRSTAAVSADGHKGRIACRDKGHMSP